MKYLIAFCIAITLTGCGISNYPPAKPKLTGDEAAYHLSSGDTVNIRIFDEPELSGAFQVDSQGMIALPLAGKIQVGGQTEVQAGQTIALALQQGGFLRHPKIALEVKKTRPFFAIGEVEQGGKYPFQNGLTVYQAVAIAGGYTYRADRDDIAIRRQTGEGAGTEMRLSAQEDTPVLPGDVIEVGERFF